MSISGISLCFVVEVKPEGANGAESESDPSL